MGTEVKSLRQGRASLIDGFATVRDGELWLEGVHIPEYTEGTWTNHSAAAPAQAAAAPGRDPQADQQDPRERAHDRAAVAVLQGRPGQGRDRAGQGQAQLRQAPDAARAAGPARGRAGDVDPTGTVTRGCAPRGARVRARPGRAAAGAGRCCWGCPSARRSAADGERIVSFAADYAVQADGSMDVTETLVWQFAGDTSHGIQRFIRTSAGYDPKPDTYRRYELSDVSASSPSGAPADVAVPRPAPRPGSASAAPTRRCRAGRPTCVRYHLAHVVNGFADHSELYWNVTGQRVDIPTDAVRVTVRGPAAVDAGGLLLRRPGLHRHGDRGPAGDPAHVRRPGPRPGRAGQRRRVVPAGCGHRRRPPTCARARRATPATPASRLDPVARRRPRGQPRRATAGASPSRSSRPASWGSWSGSAGGTSSTPV